MDEKPRTRPLEFLSNTVDEIVAEVSASAAPLYLLDGGAPRLVLLDAAAFAELEERVALLKLLLQGEREISQGKFRDFEAVFAELEQESEK